MLVISTDNHHPYYMCFVRNKKNGAYFQAAQIYRAGRGTPKNSPIRSIFNKHLSLTKTDVLSKFHQNRFIFIRVIVRTNFESETTTPTPTPRIIYYKIPSSPVKVYKNFRRGHGPSGPPSGSATVWWLSVLITNNVDEIFIYR